MPDATVADLLRTAAREIDRLDAELLLADVLGRQRAWLFAHDTETVPAPCADSFAARVGRRAAGEPCALIRGTQEFWTLSLEVSADTLVPRADTELLVELALQIPAADSRALSVLDAGTGSGAIAAALAAERPRWHVFACDVSDDALRVAARNCPRVPLFRADWLQSIAPSSFDLIVSNPPYIAEDDPHLKALQFEPAIALESGADGLDAIRHLVASSRQALRRGGWLLLEHGWTQAAAVAQLCAEAGFSDVSMHRDLAGHERATMARWP